jgi:hypothetical protein
MIFRSWHNPVTKRFYPGSCTLLRISHNFSILVSTSEHSEVLYCLYTRQSRVAVQEEDIWFVVWVFQAVRTLSCS